MPLHHILVDVGAPAGLRGHDQVAVLYARRRGDQIVLPGHVIDVDLHDAEVRNHCAEVGAHQRGQVAVEVVRRAIDLVGLGHGRDLHRLEDAVPGQVDNADVHGIILEEIFELATAEKAFAAREGRSDRATDEGERARIEAVDLDPHQPVPLQRTDEADVALGLEVEIEIEEKLDVLAGAITERRKPLVELLLDLQRRVELGSAGRATETGHRCADDWLRRIIVRAQRPSRRLGRPSCDTDDLLIRRHRQCWWSHQLRFASCRRFQGGGCLCRSHTQGREAR